MRKKEPCRRFLEASQTKKYSLNSQKYGVPLDLARFVVFAKDQRCGFAVVGRFGFRAGREIWVVWDLGFCLWNSSVKHSISN